MNNSNDSFTLLWNDSPENLLKHSKRDLIAKRVCDGCLKEEGVIDGEFLEIKFQNAQTKETGVFYFCSECAEENDYI